MKLLSQHVIVAAGHAAVEKSQILFHVFGCGFEIEFEAPPTHATKRGRREPPCAGERTMRLSFSIFQYIARHLDIHSKTLKLTCSMPPKMLEFQSNIRLHASRELIHEDVEAVSA
ncbi:MAG: hypothetical protein KK476_15625 [Sinorhizobium fredii]|uniref:hypothetical protein n=1 Tax=Rhizobium fredii TaxID=380 RepID=UPI00056C8BC7|nr:hypothetical protein [Sinorhizobium fredii]MCG5476308.1 hypothetical protein [Sinorhizobium fredii]